MLGRVALLSLEVMLTRSLVETKFQLASTALTLTVKALPAVCAEGAPVLPLAVPGAAVSPGAAVGMTVGVICGKRVAVGNVCAT